SLAGMAAALALAVAIVLAETSATLVSRTRRYLHKIAQLNASVRQLKTRVNTAERRTTTALEHANADEVLKRVLTASDLRTIKLSAGAKGSDPASSAASGSLAVSKTQGQSVLQAAGLTDSRQGSFYRAGWEEKRRPPPLAGEFRAKKNGNATVPLSEPPQAATSLLVTLESDTSA